MWLLFSIFLAFWFKTEIPRFATRINQQLFQELDSLLPLYINEVEFLAKSQLQPQQKKWENLFFLIFPLIMLLSERPTIGLIFVILVFLSLLDIYYYLTDLRYIVTIFLLILWETLAYFHNETLLFSLLFCISIAVLSQIIFKKEAFGTGDMALLIALSPLFNFNEMLLLIFISSLVGLFYSLIYWLYKGQKLQKLPFIPFISMATLIVYLL